MAEDYDELELKRLRENALKSRPGQHHHGYSSSSRNQDFLLPLPTPSQPLLPASHYHRIPLPIPPSHPPSSHPPRPPPSHLSRPPPSRLSRPQTRPMSHNSHPLPSHSSKSSSRSSSSSSSSYSSYSKEEGASHSGSSRSSRSVSVQSGSSYSSYSHSPPPPAHSPHYRRGRRGSPSPQRGPYVSGSPRPLRMSGRRPRSSSPSHHRRHHFTPPPTLPPRRHSPYFPRKQSPSYSRKDYPSPRRRSPRRPSPRRPSPRREDDGWRHNLHPLPPRRPSPRRLSPRRPSPRRPSPRRMSPRRPSPRRMLPGRPSPRRPSPRRHVLPPRADEVLYERHRLVSPPPPRLRSPPPPPRRVSPRRVRERRNVSPPPPPRARGMSPPPGRIVRDRSPRMRRNLSPTRPSPRRPSPRRPSPKRPSPRRPSPRRPREPSPRRERERRGSLRRDVDVDKRLRLASGSERFIETREEERGGGRKRKRSHHGEVLPSKQHKTEEDLLLEDEVLVDKIEKSSGLTGLDPLDEELDYDESMEDIERYLHEDEQSDMVFTLKSEVRKKPTLPEKDESSPRPPSTPPETNGENESPPHREESRAGEGEESRVILVEDEEEEEEEEGQLDPSDSDTPNEGCPQEELGETLDEMTRGLEGTENNSEDHVTEVRQERIVRQEIGEEEDNGSSLGGEALDTEEKDPPKTDTPPPPDSGSEDASAPGLISSPIRLTPERNPNGSSGRKPLTSRSRKLLKDRASKGDGENDGDDTRLPVKERLYLSKRDIERKKEASDYRQQHKISSNLESRLGPSPNDRKPFHTGRIGNRRGGQTREAKGSAMEIAQAFRREKERKNQGEGILDEQELRKGQRFAKLLNEHQTRSDNNRLSRRDEDLDKRINRIRSNNQKQLERDKEIRKDRQLHG